MRCLGTSSDAYLTEEQDTGRQGAKTDDSGHPGCRERIQKKRSMASLIPGDRLRTCPLMIKGSLSQGAPLIGIRQHAFAAARHPPPRCWPGTPRRPRTKPYFAPRATP